MKLKLDENLSQNLADLLRALSHDVHTVREEGLLSKPDEVVGQAALDEDRILLTLDVDFSDIRRYAPGTHPGIILFRLTPSGPLATIRAVVNFVSGNDLELFRRCLVIVEDARIRVRRPPPSPEV